MQNLHIPSPNQDLLPEIDFNAETHELSAVVGVRKVQARFLFHTYSATALFDTNNRQLLRGVVGTQKIG